MTFPELYHAHHSLDDEDIPFWMELTQSQGGPVLELGCGTGRVLVQFALRGYQTYGLDNQLEMLVNLMKSLPVGLRHTPHLFQADMANFRLAIRFPLILLPCNTLSTLSTTGRKKTFSNIAEHLVQDGQFAACIPNPAVLAKLPEIGESEVEHYFPHPVDGEPVQVSSSWKRTSDKFLVYWHYDHLLPDGNVQRLTVEACHEIHPVQVYLLEIEGAGLHIEAIYGNFNRTAYNTRSPYFIFTAGLAKIRRKTQNRGYTT
jgi:SAM-dependent methyltransferase